MKESKCVKNTYALKINKVRAKINTVLKPLYMYRMRCRMKEDSNILTLNYSLTAYQLQDINVFVEYFSTTKTAILKFIIYRQLVVFKCDKSKYKKECNEMISVFQSKRSYNRGKSKVEYDKKRINNSNNP